MYAAATEVERKEFMRAFIERIDLYPEKREDGCWIKNIVFSFPIPYKNGEIRELPLENCTMGEIVCLLSQQKPDDIIRIGLDLSELDITASEKKATYEEIQSYVLEHTGLKVNHLYIAQVKQKYGIIERENYNKPKSEDSKQPQCPPEKEAAITEALKYFKMI